MYQHFQHHCDDRTPIDDPSTASRFLFALLSRPPRCETIAVSLDHRRRADGVLVVTGTERPDDVLTVADHIVAAAETCRVTDAAIILASVRPHGAGDLDQLDDLDRWIELDLRLDDGGIELVEWFVIGRSVSTPRSIIGAPSRWAA